MSGYVDISQAGVALGQSSSRYVNLSSSSAGVLTIQGATSSDPVRLTGLAAPTQAWPSVFLESNSAIDIRQQHNFAAAQCVGDLRMMQGGSPDAFVAFGVKRDHG